MRGSRAYARKIECEDADGRDQQDAQKPAQHLVLAASGEPAMQPLVGFVSFYRGDVKVFETAPLAVASGLDPRTKAIPLRFSLPLTSLPTGRYECQVTVLQPDGEKAAFWRAPIVLVP